MKNLVLKVVPYGHQGNYYVIKYRKKLTGFWSFLDIFIPWNTLHRTYHSGVLSSFPDKEHPVLFQNFDEAVRVGKSYKNNPESMYDFIKSERERYEKIYDECLEYQNKRRRGKIID